MWLERTGPPFANDAIILERLLLAVGVRRGRERHELEPRRDPGVLVDATVSADERRDAAARLGLNPALRYRVIAAPLFAVWAQHPELNHRAAPGDVVRSEHGPLHAVVLCGDTPVPEVNPSGIGVATDLAGRRTVTSRTVGRHPTGTCANRGCTVSRGTPSSPHRAHQQERSVMSSGSTTRHASTV